MRQAHERAKEILEEHADQIRTMAGVLLERETVEGEAVQALLDDTWAEYLASHPEEQANEEAAEAGAVEAPAGDATGDGGLDLLGSEERHEDAEDVDDGLIDEPDAPLAPTADQIAEREGKEPIDADLGPEEGVVRPDDGDDDGE